MNKKLRVLCTNNAPIIKFGIASGFKNLGHEVFIMDEKYQLWDKSKDEQLSLFKSAIDEYKVDIVFSECFANFSEEIFLYTKQMGIAHFFYSIEDTPHDHWIGDYWSNYADYIFTTTAECLPNYWSIGKPAELMLFGCNPDFHRNTSHNNSLATDIVLVANNYSSRSYQVTDYLIPLIEQGHDLKVYGNEWWVDGSNSIDLRNYKDNYRGYFAYEDLPALYSSSKIALGFNCNGDSVTQTSMRMFEVLSIGGALLLSPYTKAQEFLFHDMVYLPRNTDEMILMANEILKMTDKQRKQKAKIAQDYVHKYHNYNLRAQQVINAFFGVKK